MGTKSLIMVKSDGKFKVAQYSNWDGNPSGQGFGVVKFIKQLNLDDIHLFKTKVDGITEWTDEDIDTYCLELNHFELSRDAGSDILDLIYKDKIKKTHLDVNFAGNSLFCEWGWSINLDTNCLDCFKGFHTEPLEPNQPFYFLQDKMNQGDKYYPIKLICSIPFDELFKFITGYEFEDYIYEILQMGDNEIMDNGIPKNWEE
jgi:hypothetical protein